VPDTQSPAVGSQVTPNIQFPIRGPFHAVEPYHVLSGSPPQGSLPQVDLRPTIQSLNLAIVDQAPRGTCSVFAMTFLLEYMYGTRLPAPANDLSEEYLNYAANRVSGDNADGDFFDKLDSGYQAWGIVPSTILPYQSTPVSSVSQDILNLGKRWPRFRVDFVKPWDSSKGATQSQLDRVVAYLDGNIPVAFGGWWFQKGQWSTKLINGVEVMDVPPTNQKTAVLTDGHSVALVGYRRDTAFPGGGYFVFRNSWGPWGDNLSGYFYMPFGYVLNYANDLVAYNTKDIVSAHIGIQAVAHQKDKLDVFVTDNHGRIDGATWQQNVLGGKWRGWWSVLSGKAKKGSAVAVVARDPNKLDLFIRGENNGIYTAAWDKNVNVNDANWQGWWHIVDGKGTAASAITAISRRPDHIDVFIRGENNGIYTAAWDQYVNDAKWQGWWRIVDGKGEASSDIAVVSRDPNKLDVFIRGLNGKVYTAAWDQGAGWRGWWPLFDQQAHAGSSVAAVSRHPDKLDLFIVGADGRIYTAAWDQNVDNAAWRGWWPVLDGVAAPSSGVAVVSRDANKLDVFIVGTDGGIWTAAWDQNISDAWQGWWRILDGVGVLGSGVTAVARLVAHWPLIRLLTSGLPHARSNLCQSLSLISFGP
jgi:hypothetical protein